MEELFYYNELYDLYNKLLTEKQRKYFEDYYFNNLSYSEMSDSYQVSRNAVFKQLHITVEKLKEYEEKLKLLEKKQKLLKIMATIKDKETIKELEKLFEE